jgi:NADH-quinone oxidoreductase subunit J
MDAIVFYGFSALTLLAALVMVTQRNPTYSAFAFIVVLCSLSIVYGMLGSPFIAILQVVVYAGAIMVLFLFVIMLLNVREEAKAGRDGWMLTGVAIALVTAFALQMASVLTRARLGFPRDFEATAAKVAEVLFSQRFLYVFEATSILILAALVGAVVLAKKDL